MDKIKTTEGDLVVRDARFAIVASRFNDFIVESLLKGSCIASVSTAQPTRMSKSSACTGRVRDAALLWQRSQPRGESTESSLSVA